VFKRLVEPYIIRYEHLQQAKTDQMLFDRFSLEKVKVYTQYIGENFEKLPECVREELANLLEIGKLTSQYIAADKEYPKDANFNLKQDEWLNRFIDEAKYVSDEQLQQAFARLLKEKIYNSDAVNKRVLDILKNIDASELKTINQYMSYFVGGAIPTSIIVDIDTDLSWLLELQNLGLIHIISSSNILYTIDRTYRLSTSDNKIEANGVCFVFNNVQRSFNISIPSYFLTKEGEVFCRIVSSKMPDNVIEFYADVFEHACQGKATLTVEKL
jgi:hypothetical protein